MANTMARVLGSRLVWIHSFRAIARNRRGLMGPHPRAPGP